MTTQLQFSIGHQMAELAADKADREIHEWREIAYAAVLDRISKGGSFCLEEVRRNAAHVPVPPNTGAWGSIANRMKKSGLVEFAGFMISEEPAAHGMPKRYWRVIS